jgi:hypothetical protein
VNFVRFNAKETARFDQTVPNYWWDCSRSALSSSRL